VTPGTVHPIEVKEKALTTLPTGEQLPDYDDAPSGAVRVALMRDWLRKFYPDQWDAPADADSAARSRFEQDRARAISLTLTALQVVGDATLVANGTYRAMRRDGADLERIAARIANQNPQLLVACDGNPATAVLAILDELAPAAPPPAVTSPEGTA
jgi:hypothetical protein